MVVLVPCSLLQNGNQAPSAAVEAKGTGAPAENCSTDEPKNAEV